MSAQCCLPAYNGMTPLERMKMAMALPMTSWMSQPMMAISIMTHISSRGTLGYSALHHSMTHISRRGTRGYSALHHSMTHTSSRRTLGYSALHHSMMAISVTAHMNRRGITKYCALQYSMTQSSPCCAVCDTVIVKGWSAMITYGNTVYYMFVGLRAQM